MSQNNWKEVLKRISLMGLSASQLDPALVDFFRKESIKGNEAQQILAGISLMALQDRGHHTFKKIQNKPSLSPNPIQSTFITQQQNGQLTHILNGDYTWAMYEFVQTISSQNLLIPPFRIPELIEYAASESWFQPWIEALTGVEGSWALSHITRWGKDFQKLANEKISKPKSIEKKLFPLLNLKRPIANIFHIVPMLDFPSPIWTLKFSEKMYDYLEACYKSPHLDIRAQEDIENLTHFAAYQMQAKEQLLFEVDDYPTPWAASLAQFNGILSFRLAGFDA